MDVVAVAVIVLETLTARACTGRGRLHSVHDSGRREIVGPARERPTITHEGMDSPTTDF
jgi:hypothetical protein